MSGTNALPGQGPWQRFIIKFRPGSAPGRDPAAADGWLRRLDRTGGGVAPRLEWQRRLGVGADLFVASPPLGREQAQRLLDALAAEPDVEYAEPDALMQAFAPRGNP